ncbi:MAG TPA: hypothetical protein VGO68_13635 [Pyrinomonadaceae bacterium]|nr:hypothetical protein [Pyrinomonadaceae bacterium]
MQIIILFTIVGSALFIAAYYVLVRRYYWGPKTTKEHAEKNDQANDHANDQTTERDV